MNHYEQDLRDCNEILNQELLAHPGESEKHFRFYLKAIYYTLRILALYLVREK